MQTLLHMVALIYGQKNWLHLPFRPAIFYILYEGHFIFTATKMQFVDRKKELLLNICFT